MVKCLSSMLIQKIKKFSNKSFVALIYNNYCWFKSHMYYYFTGNQFSSIKSLCFFFLEKRWDACLSIQKNDVKQFWNYHKLASLLVLRNNLLNICLFIKLVIKNSLLFSCAISKLRGRQMRLVFIDYIQKRYYLEQLSVWK